MRASIVLCFLISVLGANAQTPYLQILGVAQDGGYPHMGCEKSCCAPAWQDPTRQQYVVSLALVDPATKQWWLFEATPDIKEQLHELHKSTNGSFPYLPSGIFISHAHMGHYSGLMQLGREVLGSSEVPVFVLPRMEKYLHENGPWSQLVSLKNIVTISLKSEKATTLTDKIKVTAFTVPHRDEFSETAGFTIEFSGKKVLFIPDIDKWEKWSVKIEDAIQQIDIALVDATFYNATELPNRSMSEIPHPLVEETMLRFERTPTLKEKIYFIHFNHTNPMVWDTTIRQSVLTKGFHLAETGMILK